MTPSVVRESAYSAPMTSLVGTASQFFFSIASAIVVRQETPTTPLQLSPRSPALSYERMQQNHEDRAAVYQARATSEQQLYAEKRELEEHYRECWEHYRECWEDGLQGLHAEASVQVEQQLNYFEAEQHQYYHSKWQMLCAEAQECWEKSRAESMTQLIRSEKEFSVRSRSEEQQLRSQARQSEQSLEKQSADLAEQLRATNALLQEESAQLFEHGAATQQELHEHAVARY